MRIFGIAIALAVAGISPASAQAPANTAAASTTAQTPASTATAPAMKAAGPATAPAAMDHSAHAVAAGGSAPYSAPASAASTPAGPALVAPTVSLGQPDGRIGLQDQVTPIGEEAAAFHNHWLVPLCVLISVIVLVLLTIAILKFRRSANPTPSRNSHNTVLEVAWTLIPVLVLVAIAIPSIRLLRHQYSPPKADLTIKVIGNQWYWTYQYPDNGGLEIVSNMLKEAKDVKPGERFRTDADGPPLLAVDERLVIPVHRTVKFIVTGADVIHSFAVPAFWTKMDAVPGRLNETWVRVDKPGVYFGQCSELCGARHGYMPIAVEVVSDADFARWVASKGGTMPGARPAAKADSTGSSPLTPAAVPAAAPAAPAKATVNAAMPSTGAPSAKPTPAPSQGVANNL